MAARTPSPAARMKSLQEHLVVPIDESADQRAQLVLAPNEPVRLLPFAFSYLRLTLYCVLAVCSCSLLVIVSIWFPQVFTRIARKRIPYSSLGEADYMLILVHGQGIPNAKVPWLWFEFKKHRYVYNPERGEFERYLSTIREDLEHLQARINDGLDDQAVASKSELYGPNRVLIDKPHVLMLIFVKLVHPFYLFQLFSAGVWFWEEYTIYAIVILVLSATSMAYEIYAEVSNSNRLRSLVLSDRLVDAVRSSKATRIHETELVPGDLLEVTEGPMCADVLLLSGTCTADEASLTGEALPVNKEPAIGSGQVTEVSARSEYKASFLHAGSTITTVRGSGAGCKGVVLSTGFSTGKGELFRSILFPKPIVFEFERDSYRYLGVLWIVAIAAFIKRVAEGSTVGTPFGTTLVNSLDLITVAVPPALPLVLSSGIGFAMKRLREGGIFCIDSQRVNSCGQLSCFCFDKTGTLTQEHLSFVGNYIAVVTASESEAAKYGILKRFPFDAACQRSSVVVEEIATGNRFVFVKGSPEAVSAICTNTPPDLKHKTLSYSADGYYCIGFGVKELNSKTHADMNNREEVESAVEFEGLALFKNELKPETKGMLDELYAADIDIRVITGDNALTAVHVCRELEMKMKSKVAVVDVDEHSDSTVFVSVDDVKLSDLVQWTSFNSSNMEEVLAEYDVAITGAALDKLQRECGHDTVRRIIQQTLVFARVRPQQKAWIVEQLISLGLVVGMCGDGTNDCGALKAAHVGLALSSAEASIVAPFTSKAKAILDVPVLIREGRCALTTSFLGFKYMVLYPIIQLGMASVLAQVGTWADVDVQLTDNQYLWDDLAVVLVLAMCMLYTGPSSKLSLEKPPKTLFSLPIVASILGQIAIYCAFYAAAIALMAHQDSWYCPIADALAFNCAIFVDYGVDDPDDLEFGYEDTVTWLFAHLSYLVVAIAFNIKDPFRLPFWTNRIYTVFITAEVGLNLWFLLDNSGALEDEFQVMPMPSSFRWSLFGLFVAELVIAIGWEMVATRTLPRWWKKRIAEKTNTRNSEKQSTTT
uniref:Cation-transporting ATPase n=1 Tax=Phytophthora ramorum TaxID=164328 RepID=H3HBW2_PHYRM